PVPGWRPVSAGRRHSSQFVEDTKPVAEQARSEEMPPHVLLARPSQALPELRLAQDAQSPLGAFLRRSHKEPGGPVLDLKRNAAHVAADERPRLPERLRDGQP